MQYNLPNVLLSFLIIWNLQDIGLCDGQCHQQMVWKGTYDGRECISTPKPVDMEGYERMGTMDSNGVPFYLFCKLVPEGDEGVANNENTETEEDAEVEMEGVEDVEEGEEDSDLQTYTDEGEDEDVPRDEL